MRVWGSSGCCYRLVAASPVIFPVANHQQVVAVRSVHHHKGERRYFLAVIHQGHRGRVLFVGSSNSRRPCNMLWGHYAANWLLEAVHSVLCVNRFKGTLK